MKNTGRDFENFVQMVEKSLLPQGFIIDTRELEYNDEGDQIAELDIIVSGKVGATSIKYLIECRDRPSTGAAPNSWIEQLVGRRDRFKFNKVIAVSSTGFAPGAYGYAAEKGIELRTLSEIDSGDILDWFKAPNFTLIVTNGDLKNVKVNIHNADKNQERELIELMSSLNLNSKIFFHETSGDSFSIMDLWNEAMNTAREKEAGLTDGVEIDSSAIRKTLVVNYPNSGQRYYFSLSNGDVLIESIEFTADMSVKSEIIPVSKITQYGIEPNMNSIAQSVHFDLKYGEKDLDFAIHKITDEDIAKLVLTAVDRKKLHSRKTEK
jgi:hypothetical protein